MSTAERFVDARVIRARLNRNVEKALDVMEKCLNDSSLNSKDRYKIASDYLGWFVKIENELLKAEEHRENMKFKKLNTLIKSIEYDDLLDERKDDIQPNTNSRFSSTMKS